MTISRSIHIAANDIISFFFDGWVIFHCIQVPHLYPFLCQWTFRLLPCLGYCKQCCSEHWGTCILSDLEKTMAPYSSTLAWKIPWTEEPGRLQSMGSLRVGHDWATSLSLFTFMHWRRKWQPTPVFLPGESQGWGSLVAAVYGVTQSRTRLKRLNSSSNG